ncbi:MAG: cation diffusion facilitator family transporter [Acidobacteria bacterium]|jgi:cation diffusion facilitator family transporter|nr:cation diffusion facilitator family transporter [Acidobacteriota bacterium]
MKRKNLTQFAWLSIFAAIVTIGLKTGAYWLTGSVGLLSDALESLINLAAAVIALLILKLAAQPPDEDHAYGHDKAEYFAGGIEGTLILLAAVGIGWTATARLFYPQPIEHVSVGLIITAIATVVNLVVGQILIRAGNKHRSITLEADGKHLMTDVWTSVGVIIGVWAVSFTGWLFLDSLVALLVAVNIIWTGVQLVQRSALGLMDTSIDPEKQQSICRILDHYVEERKIDYHALRTRRSAVRSFVSVHILVPGAWTVHEGHQLLEEIEADIRREVDGAIVFTHLESLDDPASWYDIELDRLES